MKKPLLSTYPCRRPPALAICVFVLSSYFIHIVTAQAQAFSLSSPPATPVALQHVVQGRQSYASQHIMWRDNAGHVHIVNSIGGGELKGTSNAHFHYINTFTGAHAIVEGGPCSFGRNNVYDARANKLYWYGEYCSNTTGGAFNEFDPVSMTNRVIKLGGTTWFSGQQIRKGADNKIYFTAINSDYYQGGGGHLYSYDPDIGPSSWTDLGVIYGPSNGVSPGLAIDNQFIYVAWQDNTAQAYWHLMVRPISSGAWSEVNFGDGAPSNGQALMMDQATKKWFLRRTTDSGITFKYYWLENGSATLIAGTVPSTGYQFVEDVNERGCITMMGYGDYSSFVNAYGYDMNWDMNLPNPFTNNSTVHYGPHNTWNYPTSGFSTSSLSYIAPYYDLPVSVLSLQENTSRIFAFGDGIADFDYASQTGLPVGNLAGTSIYYALTVPASVSPLGKREVYYSGYPSQFARWNPSALTSATNPLKILLPQAMNYRIFLDYDSEGKVWIGSNACGASQPCTDYGSVAWYNPADGSVGEVFASIWTGGRNGGNGIQFVNLAMCNGRSKIIVSSNDGKLTVLNTSTKTVEGDYNLGTKAYLVEVAEDQVIGVTTSADPLGARVFLFKPSNRTMIKAPQPIGVPGNTFGSADGRISRRNFKLEVGPDGYAWLYVDQKIYRINPRTLGFEYVTDGVSSSSKLMWAGNKRDLLLYGDSATYIPGLLAPNSIGIPNAPVHLKITSSQ